MGELIWSFLKAASLTFSYFSDLPPKTHTTSLMPGETKEHPSAGTETVTPTKTKHQTSSKAALARITLLDGSILDVTIDVS